MTNEEIIKRVNAWQGAGFIHPLTCGVNSEHPNLVPVVVEGSVILKCTECEYIQKSIPTIVLETAPEMIEDGKQKLRELGFKI